MKLFNKYSKEDLTRQLREKSARFTTISFYKYAHIADPKVFRDTLYRQWVELGVVGRTYVAREGINAQIGVPDKNVDLFKQQLYQIDFLNGVGLNAAVDESNAEFPFLKLKIKVRPKILADGLNDNTFDVTDTGQHLCPQQFNELTDDPDTILIDMRNNYESEVGHFKGAVTPDVDTFKQSLPMIEQDILKGNEDQNIVMYCTGGIRCEKASAWFKHRGFAKVHQLNGGIIRYARECRKQGIDNKFIGKNFVFDQRLSEKITDDVIAICHQCNQPCDTHTNCAYLDCNLLFIQCEKCQEKMDGCCSERCKKNYHLPREQQLALRKKMDQILES